MDNKTENSKRIAKNTLFLYARMIVTTLVSLYTARIVLKQLGVIDFGINNVVGGLVEFTAVITAMMTSATQRFLAFDLGKGDISGFQNTFSMLVNVFLCFCFIALCFLELVGPYAVSNWLVIPTERLYAAQIIFQMSIVTFLLNTLSIPYTAAIVAYEKIGIYAYFAFIDVGFKLLIAFMLSITPFDRLITLGFLGICARLAVNGALMIYSKKKLEGCQYKKYWDRDYFNRILGYSGWSLLGSTNQVLMTQGQSLIINVFFGPAINAAKAIADRIKNVVYSFSANFFMAVSPQIIKSYSIGDIDYMRELVIKSSKYSYYLMLMLSIPLISNMESILEMWLCKEQVSFEMIMFCDFSLLFCMVSSLECPLTKSVQATGKVKKYEIYVGCITLTFLPICYILFKCGLQSYYSMLLLVVIFFVSILYRSYHVRNIINLAFVDYIKKVIMPILIVTALAFLLTQHKISSCFNVFFDLAINVIFEILVVLVLVVLIGLKRSERSFLLKYIKGRFNK